MNLFYDECGTNRFMENVMDTQFILCNASEVEIDESDKLWEYIDKKGLFLSNHHSLF